MISNNTVNLSGAEIRAAKREYNATAFTRAQAINAIKISNNPDVIQKFLTHRNKHVQRYASYKAACLYDRQDQHVAEKVDELLTIPPAEVEDEFAALVARFVTEGKKDPVKSARASIAAKAQAAKKRAAKEHLAANQ